MSLSTLIREHDKIEHPVMAQYFDTTNDLLKYIESPVEVVDEQPSQKMAKEEMEMKFTDIYSHPLDSTKKDTVITAKLSVGRRFKDGIPTGYPSFYFNLRTY